MEHEPFRAEALRVVECLERHFHRALADLLAAGAELVAVRRIDQHLDGLRAEVVQACESDLAAFGEFEHALHHRDVQAVAELDVVEAEIDDLAEHVLAIRVAGRIPAGGEGEHFEQLMVES